MPFLLRFLGFLMYSQLKFEKKKNGPFSFAIYVTREVDEE
jgi:hypothetical protein